MSNRINPACHASTAQPRVSILILAGGRATRMQGVDKGLVQLQGQTLVEHIYQQVSHLSDDVLISANRNQASYQKRLPHCHVITDDWHDFRGPLAGIYSGLKHSKYDYLWVIPCDFIFLPSDCLQQLWHTLTSTQSSAVYARFNAQAFYPLCLLHHSLSDSLYTTLNQQQFAVRHWLAKQHAQVINFQINPQLPLNLNSLDDVELLEQCYNITSNSYPTSNSGVMP